VIELVASEETGVAKPAAMAFDDAGRLWCVTATAYPRDMDNEGWRRPGPDRVVVIDSPLLGGPRAARVFADGLVMPLGVLPEKNAVVIAQGPEILRLADRDGDGRADERRVLLRGFGVQDSHTLPHLLVRRPGGRIAFSQGVLNDGVVIDAAGRAYNFPKAIVGSMTADGTDLQFHSAGLNNIWGWDQDRLGRIFVHEANDLGYSLVPFEDDTSYPSFIQTKLHPNSPLHPPTAEGLNLGGTGFCGIAIAEDRAGSFPESARGNFYISNPILGAIHTVAGTQQPDGVWKFTKGADLLTGSDPMFRPVAVTFGPDGALYIADWYNRIVSHNEVPRDHPGRDKDHGRIWRVRHTGRPRGPVADFTQLPTAQLPAALASDSKWAMRAAWHQISERQDRSVVPALVKLLGALDGPVDARIHALWSLEALGYFDAELWRRLLRQDDANLRREAVRALSTLRVPAASGAAVLAGLVAETNWSVRFEVLRYLRRALVPVSRDHIAWLKEWTVEPARKTTVAGWKGPFLALDGSYQRAFQDFLLTLVQTNTPLPAEMDVKWSGVLTRAEPAAGPEMIQRRMTAIAAQLPGSNVERGRDLTTSLCLGCHSIADKGVGFAPPLDGSSRRDVAGILAAIVTPDVAIESVFRLFRVVTKGGETLDGFKQAENRNSILLRFVGGSQRTIAGSEIASAGYVEGRSVMPDLAAGMTPEDVASIVAYLRTLQ
jgi:putative membrane-bound dehydrogenase-like protein